jgi:hypothetical protein
MMSANAINVHRKSGEAERRDLRFPGPFLEMFFDRASGVERSAVPSSRRLLSAVFEDLFRQVVLYLGLIAHHFVVGGS